MQIIPIRELKNTAKISELVNNTDKPVFVTKNGYGDMVIMSMKVYEEKMAMLEEARLINESLKDIENGAEPINGEEYFSKIRKKYESQI